MVPSAASAVSSGVATVVRSRSRPLDRNLGWRLRGVLDAPFRRQFRWSSGDEKNGGFDDGSHTHAVSVRGGGGGVPGGLLRRNPASWGPRTRDCRLAYGAGVHREPWNAASRDERAHFCNELVRRLPAGFAFEGVRRFLLGRQSGEVGQFAFEGRAFVYVPGGEVSLGFDAQRWTPGDDELASFRDTAEAYGIEETMHEYLDQMTLSPRTVEVPSMIVEQFAQEPGWIEIDEDEARDVMGRHFPDPPSNVTVASGTRTRVSLNADGTARYHRSSGETHAEFVRRLTPFRLPTNDEWEHICGGGADSLFRWGDHVPCDIYPVDVSVDEARRGREWVSSSGSLERPAGGFEPTFSLHREPNAYGLVISGNPYHAEILSTPDFVRGGDGGCTICGGAGLWVGWLTLATSFFDRELMTQFAGEPIDGEYTRARRVLTV